MEVTEKLGRGPGRPDQISGYPVAAPGRPSQVPGNSAGSPVHQVTYRKFRGKIPNLYFLLFVQKFLNTFAKLPHDEVRVMNISG